MASPHLKHGRYSKHLPTRLLAKYEEAANDQELLSLREEIQLIDTRLVDLIDRVETGEAGALYTRLKNKFRDFEAALSQGDQQATNKSLIELKALITRGVADYHAWGEIGELITKRRSIVESERKRLVEMQQFISAEKATLLVTALLDSVKRNVTDRSTLASITSDFVRLTGGSGSSRAVGN